MVLFYTLQKDDGKYVKFLKFLRENKKNIKKPMDPYTDPDNKKNEIFYSKLCEFLNQREKEFKLKGTYKYRFVFDNGIEASEDGKFLMYLVSDQFGFSAPRVELNHIYDDYLISEDFDGNYEKIKDWIKNSRTLGGSFLWPKDEKGDFNKRRGGTKRYIQKYYIQDRVDLTLEEVKSFYGDKKKCPILNEVVKGCPEMKVWLGHFGEGKEGFSTFTEFFMFDDDFVDKNGDIIKLKHMENKTGEDDNIYQLSQHEKREMLDDLCNVRILNRTNNMENFLNKNEA